MGRHVRILILSLATWLGACGRPSEDRLTREVAVQFAVAVQQHDTSAMKGLSRPDKFSDLLPWLPDVGDWRLRFSISEPNVEVRAETPSVIEYLIRADSQSALPAGVYVVVQKGTPPRVRAFQVWPDI